MTHGIDLGFETSADKANERDQDTTDSGTDETILDKPPEPVPERGKEPDQAHPHGTGDSKELDLVLNVVELGRTRRRKGVKQDIGALVRRTGRIEVFGVGVLDNDLAAGRRVSDLQGEVKECETGNRPSDQVTRDIANECALATYPTFALGTLLVPSDRVHLVGVHPIHHLLLFHLTLCLLLARRFAVMRLLLVGRLTFSSLAGSSPVLPMLIPVPIDPSMIGIHGPPLGFDSLLLFGGLSFFANPYSLHLLRILLGLLVVGRLVGLVLLDRRSRVVESITLTVDP